MMEMLNSLQHHAIEDKIDSCSASVQLQSEFVQAGVESSGKANKSEAVFLRLHSYRMVDQAVKILKCR